MDRNGYPHEGGDGFDRFDDFGTGDTGEPIGGDNGYDALEPTDGSGDDLPDGLPEEDGESRRYASDELSESLSVNGDDTVENLSETEQEQVRAAFEGFVADGEYYERSFMSHHSDRPATSETERGFMRPISKEALAAAGLGDYEHGEVSTESSTEEEGYAIGVRLTRTVMVDMPVPSIEGGEPTVLPVEGEESKGYDFIVTDVVGEAAAVADAQSALIAPKSGTITIDPTNPVAVMGFMMDDEAPLLTRAELAGVMRAMNLADQYPELPPPPPSANIDLVLESTLGTTEVDDIEPPEEGLSLTDMPQAARGALMKAIDTYGRLGHQVESGSRNRFEHPIPEDILRAHGIRGSATAVINEATDEDDGFYRIGISLAEPVSDDVPDPNSPDNPAHMQGSREVFVAAYALTGPKVGTYFPDQPDEDPEAGAGIHLTCGGQESLIDAKGNRWTRLTHETNYAEARGLLHALRDAIERQTSPNAEGPRQPEPLPDTASQVLRHTLGVYSADQLANAEVPEAGDHYTDLSQAARGALLKEVDDFARSGETGPFMTTMVEHSRAIPEDILRANGIEGVVDTAVMEKPDGNFYRVAISMNLPVSGQVVDPLLGGGATAYAEGVRSVTFNLFTSQGDKIGVASGTTEDPTGTFGIQLTARSAEMLMTRDGRAIQRSYEAGFDDAKPLLNALRQANERRRQEEAAA